MKVPVTMVSYILLKTENIPNCLCSRFIDAVLPVSLDEVAPRDGVLCSRHEVVDRNV